MLFSSICHIVAFFTVGLLILLLPSCILGYLAIVASFAFFLLISYLCGNVLDRLPRFRVSAKNKAVFITGCDSGFGFFLAQRLDGIGYQVFAGCFDPSGKGAQQLKDCTTNKLQLVQIDVTSDESVQQAVKFVQNNLDNNRLWAVVNNAGVIVRGELEWTPLEAFEKQFEVNTIGVVRVTQAFLPYLRKSKGRVVTVTSFGGRYTITGLGSYCMSKHAAISFCEGLRREMKKWDVQVITVQPFSYKSFMTEPSEMLRSADEAWEKASPDLRRSYGEGYIDAFKRAMMKFNHRSANPDIHQVIDSLVEAVTVTSPHYTYTPGDLVSVLLFWFVTKLPPLIGDFIVRKYVTSDCDIEQYVKHRQGKGIKQS